MRQIKLDAEFKQADKIIITVRHLTAQDTHFKAV